MPDTRAKLLARLLLQMNAAEVGQIDPLHAEHQSGHGEHRSTAKAKLINLIETVLARDPQPEHVPHDPQP